MEHRSSRRDFLALLLGGTAGASIVVASAVVQHLSEGNDESADADLESRVKQLNPDADSRKADELYAWINGGFRNGGFLNGGFRNGGFRNGGFLNGGGWRRF